ncbi:TPM domain-containing protein [Siminovitchia sp. FSL H7-0308]|uniref:TPM domain-containing protein n=1 Tax=Siminovitchia sp. FSL H7-0308 TaxID=2921432 RepID=UPI0030EF119C
MRNNFLKSTLMMAVFFLLSLLVFTTAAANSSEKQRIYDDAGLLSESEVKKLEALAKKYGAKRNTDFIILTTNNEEGKDTKKLTQDFYDQQAPGYDKPNGNTVMLTLDMKKRNVYVVGFYKGKKYLDNERADLVRKKITPDLSDGHYDKAFQSFIKTSSKYMGFRPGVNPENLFFNGWFQIIASLGIALAAVGIMAFNTGGRVTVNARTYHDQENTKVKQRKDQYIRTKTTKRRKPSNKNSGGSAGFGGGGGTTKGGHSHSGSMGKF